MKSRKTIGLLVLALVLIMALLLSACSNNIKPETNHDNTNNSENSNYPMILDNYGRTVTINSKPQKALLLVQIAQNSCCTWSQGLYHRYFLANHSRGPLPEYEKQYADMPQLMWFCHLEKQSSPVVQTSYMALTGSLEKADWILMNLKVTGLQFI